MIADEIIITAIFTGVASILAILVKNIKSSHCWSKDNCCDCTNLNASRRSLTTPPPTPIQTQILASSTV